MTKDDVKVALWHGVAKALVMTQTGIVGCIALGVGLSWAVGSGVALLFVGVLLVAITCIVNIESAVRGNRAMRAAQERALEHMEVAKLQYENAVRHAKVGGGDPMAVINAAMHAQQIGVTVDELEEIAERVQKSKDHG